MVALQPHLSPSIVALLLGYREPIYPRVSSLIKAWIAFPAGDCLPIFSLPRVRSRIESMSGARDVPTVCSCCLSCWFSLSSSLICSNLLLRTVPSFKIWFSCSTSANCCCSSLFWLRACLSRASRLLTCLCNCLASSLSVTVESSLLGCPVALLSSTTGLSIFPAVPPIAIAVPPGLLLLPALLVLQCLQV